MHYTLHLTGNCNMACDYCYVSTGKLKTMSFETARKAVDLAALKSEGSIGIIFFGGEPLLEKELLADLVCYCRAREQKDGSLFHFKVTTNGLLLDTGFLEFSAKYGVFVALSHDGVLEAHDLHRKDKKGSGTFDLLSARIDSLLSYQPYAPALMTVNPDTVRHYAASVRYLFNKGFRYVICSLNYAGEWKEKALESLKEQYLELSDLYLEKTLREEKFYLSPFEVKISSHIHRSSYCKERCELGKKQISVAPDGVLYPCVQFVGDPDYAIGHVDTGINGELRDKLYRINETDKAECGNCAVKSRCNNHCGCLNRQATGHINRVSPVLCAHERILMPIADSLAEKLYKRRNAMFIQKHYNNMYPLVSLVEDKLKQG